MIGGTEEEGVETPTETAFYHRMMGESGQHLKAMKDKYKGKDCILMGLGPSLNKTDLSLIRDKYIFTGNSFYLFTDKLNIHPQFYGLSDGEVFNSFGDDVLRLDTQLFMARSVEVKYLRNYGYYSKIVKREPILIQSLLPEMTESKKFSKDISEGIYSGWTVIIDIGLQLAYHLGFKRAILIGCDCAQDQEFGGHFYDTKEFTNYVPREKRTGIEEGFKEREDKLRQHAEKFWIPSYQVCKRAWEEDGREIINATVGGALEVFQRRTLEELYPRERN